MGKSTNVSHHSWAGIWVRYIKALKAKRILSLVTTPFREMVGSCLAAITKALDRLEMPLRKGRWAGE